MREKIEEYCRVGRIEKDIGGINERFGKIMEG